MKIAKTYYPPKQNSNVQYYPYKNHFIVPDNGLYRIYSPSKIEVSIAVKSIWQAHRIIDQRVIEK